MTIRQRARRVFMLAADRTTQAVYRLSGGRVGGKQLRYSILLLHSTGRTTGQVRTHALLYLCDGERYVVCASNYGAPRHPNWYLNLLAHPRVRIEAGPRRLEVLAEVAAGDERERLWRRWIALWPPAAGYQRDAAGRELPIVILRPVAPTEGEQPQ
ncbi:MAG TPA: nitroreductase family deazaflavin-dependent oxidoreductase [Ktedonobacterales bacterium]